MKNPPRFIVLENVCGFEKSTAHDLLRDVMIDKSYYVEEYVISPTEIGIPNSRPRYYLLAKLACCCCKSSNTEIMGKWPVNDNTAVYRRKTIGEYLCSEAARDSSLSISSETVKRFANVMHFVTPGSCYSACFTKAYSRFAAGTGPILVLFKNTQEQRLIDRNKIQEQNRASVPAFEEICLEVGKSGDFA
ncbi:unnamed protein product [Gongylonema pulchrum]|uniref:DNA (cytosine-5-)-methyltransferase n=1 Tax=Gongylonema pulchrum TaxID=637853 RepID=A0A183E7U5_9BILA|nr:unnamed protein product [Gongylonema pulchrum]